MPEARDPNLFGELLRNWRNSRNWTLAEFAAQLRNKGFDYDPSTLGKYERKERTPDGSFLAHLTCIGLEPTRAADWALAIGREAGIDIHRSFQRARQQVRC